VPELKIEHAAAAGGANDASNGVGEVVVGAGRMVDAVAAAFQRSTKCVKAWLHSIVKLRSGPGEGKFRPQFPASSLALGQKRLVQAPKNFSASRLSTYSVKPPSRAVPTIWIPASQLIDP
jgi:hypothetical protein